MSLTFAAAVVVAFMVILGRLDIEGRVGEIRTRAASSLSVLRDARLDDDAKERALRAHARRLFLLLGVLCGSALLALGLPLLVVWLLDLAGYASFAGVLEVLQRLDFLLAASVAAVAVALLRGRWRAS